MSRRILRLSKAAAAIGLASAPLIAFSVPAFAQSYGKAPSYEWWLSNLHVAQAWRSTDGSGITVAVLSDGVAANQPYLAGSVISGPDFTGSVRTPGGVYYGLIGTDLAGLIVGHGQAGTATEGTRLLDGVAPDAKVLSIRVTLSPHDPLWSNRGMTGRLPDAIAAGIRYAVEHGASVIDLPADPEVSDPAIASGTSTTTNGSNSAERAAVAYAERKDVVLVAPAGDNGQAGDAMNYPAAYPGVIAVGAFGKTFVKAPFSSRRSYVTLTAAGQNVVVANQAGFTTLNSTCAAGAIVAGIAALVRSEFPNLTASQVRTALTKGTIFRPKGGQADGSGFGTVDATGALASAMLQSPPHARPAMLGAAPRARPVAPAVASSGTIIAHDLTGDAEVSALVLALLLIPITLYGTMAKRRERHQAPPASQRSQYAIGQSGHGTMLADPLLELFGPQARPEPAITRPIPTPRFQPRPSLTDRSTLSASPAARPSLPAPVARTGLPSRSAPPPTAPPRGAPPTRSAPPPLGTPPLGTPPLGTPPLATRNPSAAPPAPAAQAGADGIQPSRPVPGTDSHQASDVVMGATVRHVQVSGSPPWEPAPEPTSDLPWPVIAPQSGPARTPSVETPAIPPPPDSVWDSPAAIRSSAPRVMFEPAPTPPQSQAMPLSAPPPPSPPPTSWQDLPGARMNRPHQQRRIQERPHLERPNPDSDRGPIFVWQPMESTDQLTATDPRHEDRRRRRD